MALQPVAELAAPASSAWGRDLVDFVIHGLPGMPDLGVLFSFASFLGFWLALWAMQTLTHRAGIFTGSDWLRLVQRLAFGALAMVFLLEGTAPLMADVRPWMTSIMTVVIIDVVLLVACILNQPAALVKAAERERVESAQNVVGSEPSR